MTEFAPMSNSKYSKENKESRAYMGGWRIKIKTKTYFGTNRRFLFAEHKLCHFIILSINAYCLGKSNFSYTFSHSIEPWYVVNSCQNSNFLFLSKT